MPLALRALLLILVALVPAVLVQIRTERQTREQRAEQVADQAMRLVRLVAAQQIRTLEGAQQVLAAMAAHDAVRALRPGEECSAFLARLVGAYPRYTIANVFDPEGESVCSSAPAGTRSANVRDRAYFEEAMRTRGFAVGTYVVGRATRQGSLHLAAPLLADDGAVRAVMALGLSIEWLVRDLESLQLPEGSASTIADRDGTILARSRDPAGFVGTRLPPFAMELLHGPGPGVIEAPALDGVRRVAAYIPISQPPFGLFVTMGLDAEATLRAAAERDRVATWLVVGSLLLTFAVALIGFSAAVERPVRVLLGAARRDPTSPTWLEG